MAESYQVDVFAIIALIGIILIIVFLVIAAVYFYNLMNLRPPTQAESTFLFWTSVVLIVIFVALGIYALIRIFAYRAVVYKSDTIRVRQVAPVVQVPVSQPIQFTPVPREITQPLIYNSVPEEITQPRQIHFVQAQEPMPAPQAVAAINLPQPQVTTFSNVTPTQEQTLQSQILGVSSF